MNPTLGDVIAFKGFSFKYRETHYDFGTFGSCNVYFVCEIIDKSNVYNLSLKLFHALDYLFLLPEEGCRIVSKDSDLSLGESI